MRRLAPHVELYTAAFAAVEEPSVFTLDRLAWVVKRIERGALGPTQIAVLDAAGRFLDEPKTKALAASLDEALRAMIMDQPREPEPEPWWKRESA